MSRKIKTTLNAQWFENSAGSSQNMNGRFSLCVFVRLAIVDHKLFRSFTYSEKSPGFLYSETEAVALAPEQRKVSSLRNDTRRREHLTLRKRFRCLETAQALLLSNLAQQPDASDRPLFIGSAFYYRLFSGLPRKLLRLLFY